MSDPTRPTSGTSGRFQMNRRNFLKRLGAVGLVAAAPAILTPERKYWPLDRTMMGSRTVPYYDFWWTDNDGNRIDVTVYNDPDLQSAMELATVELSNSASNLSQFLKPYSYEGHDVLIADAPNIPFESGVTS